MTDVTRRYERSRLALNVTLAPLFRKLRLLVFSITSNILTYVSKDLYAPIDHRFRISGCNGVLLLHQYRTARI